MASTSLHFIVVPSLDGGKATTDKYASTSVFCPYRSLTIRGEANVESSATGGWEIVGVVPKAIIDYETRAKTPLDESNMSDYIDIVRYRYLANGHKVISIVYNEAWTEGTLKCIEFDLLCESIINDFHETMTVEQPIVRCDRLSAGTGVQLDYDSLFAANHGNGFQKSQFQGCKIDNDVPHYGFKILNSSLTGKVVTFNTYAYTNANQDEATGSGVGSFMGRPSGMVNTDSANVRDFFLPAYFNYTGITAATSDASYEIGDFDVTMSGRGMWYEFRQLCRSAYDYSATFTGGTLNKDTINPLADIVFDVTDPDRQGSLARNGFAHIDILSRIYDGLNVSGLFTTGNGGASTTIFDPSPTNIADKSQSDALIYAQGFCGLFNGFTSGRKAGNALWVQNRSGHSFNGVIFAISRNDGNNHTLTDQNNGEDTTVGTLNKIAQFLIKGGEIAEGQGGMTNGVANPSFYGTSKYKGIDSGVTNNMGALLQLGYAHPQEVISNFIFGQHGKFLRTPGADRTKQGVFQTACVASLFGAYSMPTDMGTFPQGTGFALTGNQGGGLIIDNNGLGPSQIDNTTNGSGVGLPVTDTNSYVLQAIPYYYFVSNYANINNIGGPTSSTDIALTHGDFNFLPDTKKYLCGKNNVTTSSNSSGYLWNNTFGTGNVQFNATAVKAKLAGGGIARTMFDALGMYVSPGSGLGNTAALNMAWGIDPNAAHFTRSSYDQTGSPHEGLSSTARPLTHVSTSRTNGDVTGGEGTSSLLNFNYNSIDQKPWKTSSLLTTNSTEDHGTLYSDNVRKAYVRGCLDFDRGDLGALPQLNGSKFYLDVIINPQISTGVDQTNAELRFVANYNTTPVPDTVLEGYPSDDCDCEALGNQFVTSDGDATATDMLDIFRVKYIPGKNVDDAQLFPINTTDFSANSRVESAVTVLADTPLTGNTLIVNLDAHLPTSLDRPFPDLDLSNYEWTGRVSSILIAGREGAVTQAGRLDPDTLGDFDDMEAKPQVFRFVTLGSFPGDAGGGGGLDDPIPGCTNPAAVNYDPTATEDDGSCFSCQEDVFLTSFQREYGMVNTISPHPAVTSNSLTLGFTGAGQVTNVNGPANGYWGNGQIGNAHSHWGPATDAAYQGNDFPAVPYGDAFDSDVAGVNVAAPYTEFLFSTTLNEVPLGTFDADAVNLVNYAIAAETATANCWTLRIYSMDEWTGGENDFSFTGVPFLLDELPVSAPATPLGVMSNQGSSFFDLKFASYSIADNAGGWVPNVTNPLTDPYGQNYLEPGKHYVAALTLDMARLTNFRDEFAASFVCDQTYVIPFNFWVTFCGCDLEEEAINYVGDLFDFPWSPDVAFPSGLAQLPECTTPAAASRRIDEGKDADGNRKLDATTNGFCLVPQPPDCSTFIDACFESSSSNCVPTPTSENPANQDFVGSITANVFGVYTGSDVDSYAFYVNNELFTFNIYLVDLADYPEGYDPAVNGVPTVEDAAGYFSFATQEDYVNFGFNPINDNELTITFSNLGQGTYGIVVEQTGFMATLNQETSCPPAMALGGTNLVLEPNLDDSGECPDYLLGCTDQGATNYDPFATVDDGSCEYAACDDLFVTGKFSSVTSTASVINCGQINIAPPGQPAEFVNALTETNTGSITTAYDVTIGGDNDISGMFVVAWYRVYDGNVAAAYQAVLDGMTGQQGQIFNTARTTAINITAGNVTVGQYLPFDGTGEPVLTTGEILPAGFYIVVLLPSFVDIDAEDNCFYEIGVNIIDQISNLESIQVGFTTNYDGCPEPCNDQTNPENCDDLIGGCTDESAINYNPDANYDIGNCEYTPDCASAPDSAGCEDCTTAAATGEISFRDCDEFEDTMEGCCDPLACNYDPNADVCVASRCEYCCDGEEDCIDGPEDDECELPDGTILPDCVVPECPDPSNPDCDPIITNPCPAGADCPEPPEPECVILGNCPEGPDPEGPDPDVVIDDIITTEVTCPALIAGVDFATIQSMAIACIADHGNKMLFKLRSGTKVTKTDLRKLALINYLFNNSMNNACMANCEVVEIGEKYNKQVLKDSCEAQWKKSNSQIWTSTSTYDPGTVVAVHRLEGGQVHRTYWRAIDRILPGDPSPLNSTNNTKWRACVNVVGKSADPNHPVAYAPKLFEFVMKFCQECSLVATSGTSYSTPAGGSLPPPPKERTNNRGSGLIDDQGNIINLF